MGSGKETKPTKALKAGATSAAHREATREKYGVWGSLRMPKQMKASLQRHAKRRFQSLNGLANQILTEWLEREEATGEGGERKAA